MDFLALVFFFALVAAIVVAVAYFTKIGIFTEAPRPTVTGGPDATVSPGGTPGTDAANPLLGQGGGGGSYWFIYLVVGAVLVLGIGLFFMSRRQAFLRDVNTGFDDIVGKEENIGSALSRRGEDVIGGVDVAASEAPQGALARIDDWWGSLRPRGKAKPILKMDSSSGALVSPGLAFAQRVLAALEDTTEDGRVIFPNGHEDMAANPLLRQLMILHAFRSGLSAPTSASAEWVNDVLGAELRAAVDKMMNTRKKKQADEGRDELARILAKLQVLTTSFSDAAKNRLGQAETREFVQTLALPVDKSVMTGLSAEGARK